MNKLIDKIVERMDGLYGNICTGIPCNDCPYNNDCYEGEHAENRAVDMCKQIVHEEAKAYKPTRDLIIRNDAIQRFIDEMEEYKNVTFHINEIKRLLQDVEPHNEVKTNADYIRNMTDEELSEVTIQYDDYVGRYYTSDCKYFYEEEEALKHEIEWLKAERKEN